ncbi:hypothetical protein B296_00044779 [Ensete ventricosum]|uniref:Uncharacterized protein n=1 Tax=Ensete ventricosum TaxID=4639 RepID=A0A426WWQ5_ENSVE|nr:hypothetical protein B296_00044779 [Ensete ventricosum]
MQISGRKKREEEEGAPHTFPLLPHLPVACQAQPSPLPSPSATSPTDHLFLPLHLHYRHCSTRAPSPHTFLPCSCRWPASPQPQPPPTDYRCPSPCKSSPPLLSASATSVVGQRRLYCRTFLPCSCRRPTPASTAASSHRSSLSFPMQAQSHSLYTVFLFSLICRWHLCSSPFFLVAASLLSPPPSAAYSPNPLAHTRASATQSLPPLHQPQLHPSYLLLSHCRSPRRTVATLFLPPMPAIVFIAPFALLTLPACRSSAAVATPSSAAQPSLLPHLPSLLLPCFLLPLLITAAFLFNRSITYHVVASLSPVAALTATNRLCPRLADADNLVAVKSYYIYDICL